MNYNLRNTNRSATDSIRGYSYQLVATVAAWIELEPQEVLICEGNEDFDKLLVGADGAVLIADEHQLKDAVALPSGKKALETIRAFMIGFREHREAGRRSKFIFTSTAGMTTTERSGGVTGAIRNWCALASEDATNKTEKRRALGGTLANLLSENAAELNEKRDLDDLVERPNDITALLTYLNDNRAWGEFLDSVVWEFGAPKLPSLKARTINAIGRIPDLGLSPELVFASLLHQVITAAADGKTDHRILTSTKLREFLERDKAVLREWIIANNVTALSDLLSPLQTPEEYFFNLCESKNLFHHADPLVGLDDEVDAIKRFAVGTSAAKLLTAAPGAGKSRVLRQAAKKLADSAVTVRFLDVSSHALLPGTPVDLPEGRTLLVLEDAEPGPGLDLACRLRAQAPDRTRLLLATWPHRAAGLSAQLIGLGINQAEIEMQELRGLSNDEAVELAAQSLAGKAPYLAGPIGLKFRESPFAIVVACRLLAEGKVDVGSIDDDDAFNQLVVEPLASKAAEARRRVEERIGLMKGGRVLSLLALLGRARCDPHILHTHIAKFAQIEPSELTRFLDGMSSTGFVVRRGRTWSFAHDVLARKQAQEACLSRGVTTGFGEKVFERFRGFEAKNIVLRLAEITSDQESVGHSTPLDGVWSQLERELKHSSGYGETVRCLEMLEGVGYWVPDSTLDLVASIAEVVGDQDDANTNKWSTSAGDVREALARVLLSVTYRGDFLAEALEQLLALVRLGAGAEVVEDVSKYQRWKPLFVQSEVLDFVERQLESGSDDELHLLSFLKPMLQRVGEYQTVDGDSWTIHKFAVDCAGSSELRRRVRASVASVLLSKNAGVVACALNLCSLAISPELYNQAKLDDDERALWETEEKAWIDMLTVLEKQLTTTAKVSVAELLHWHAKHGTTSSSALACALQRRLLAAPGVRRVASFSDRCRLYVDDTQGDDHWRAERERFFLREAQALAREFPSPADAAAELQRLRSELQAHGIDFSPHLVARTLAKESPEYCLELVVADLGSGHVLGVVYGELLYHIAQQKPEACLRVVNRIFEEGNSVDAKSLQLLVLPEVWRTAQEVADVVLTHGLASKDSAVVRAAVKSLKQGIRGHSGRVVRDLLSLDVSKDPMLMDDIAAAFAVGIDSLAEEHTEKLLSQLTSVQSLETRWTQRLLSNLATTRPDKVLHLLIERALSNRSIPKFRNFPINVTKDALDKVWTALRATPERLFWSQLFWLVAKSSTQTEASLEESVKKDVILTFLEDRANDGEQDDLLALGQLIRDGPDGWIRTRPGLVDTLLTRAKAVGGAKIFEELFQRCYQNATPSSWSSRAGKPPRELVRACEDARQASQKFRRGSPSRTLFTKLEKAMERRIAEEVSEYRLWLHC